MFTAATQDAFPESFEWANEGDIFTQTKIYRITEQQRLLFGDIFPNTKCSLVVNTSSGKTKTETGPFETNTKTSVGNTKTETKTRTITSLH